MPRVDVFSWNPRRSRLPRRLTQRLPLEIGRRVNNFGDLLGPVVVERVLAMHGIDPRTPVADRRLLSVGSVLHFARNHDVIWGSGVNGKMPDDRYLFDVLDVRAVRGPRTRDFLRSRGIEIPAIFGDPVLLLPIVMPELITLSQSKRYSLTVVPNFNDLPSYVHTPNVLDPRSPVSVCLERIAQSEFVVGSSLHAIVVAEALGIPARLISSPIEDPFKYEDYYRGTGRQEPVVANTLEQALGMQGEREPIFDATLLLNAFPFDLWQGSS
jgi:pyruvyltransferase